MLTHHTQVQVTTFVASVTPDWAFAARGHFWTSFLAGAALSLVAAHCSGAAGPLVSTNFSPMMRS